MEVGIEPELSNDRSTNQHLNNTLIGKGPNISKEQTSELLDAIFGHMTTEIAQNRNIPVETLVALIDQAPFANTQAKDKQLVDHLLYEDEIEDFLDEEWNPPLY